MKIEEFPGTSFHDASLLCMETTSDGSPHDYRAAAELHLKLPEFIVNLDNPKEIRNSLSILISNSQFDWVYYFPSGREAVKSALTRNEFQVFRNAELFVETPSLEIVSWWDEIANKLRAQVRDNSYREAELRSLLLERKLLESLGCPYEPSWVALNDNSLGFDIRSYRFAENEWIPFAIEVKSSSTNKLRFFLTRNEFNLAMRMKTNYALHYWAHDSEVPITLSHDQIFENTPKDSGIGKWDSMLIEGELVDCEKL